MVPTNPTLNRMISGNRDLADLEVPPLGGHKIVARLDRGVEFVAAPIDAFGSIK